MKNSEQEKMQNLIERYVHQQVVSHDLSDLEENVWRSIRARQTDTSRSVLYNLLTVPELTQFRLASLVLAITLGLLLSLAVPTGSDSMPLGKNNEIAELEVFDAHSPFLLSSIQVID